MLARVEAVSGVVEVCSATHERGIRGCPILVVFKGTGYAELGMTASELRQLGRVALAVAEEVEARERNEREHAAQGYAFNMRELLQMLVSRGNA